MVSGSISLPYPGFFSPFPHGTCSLSVSKEYLALEDGPPFFNQDFSCPDLLLVRFHINTFRLQGFHLLSLAFPNHSAKSLYFIASRLFPFRSPLLRKSRLISFPLGTEMFQFPRFASLDLLIQSRIIGSLLLGSPIQISSDHRLLPAPRGFSQAATSFFASYCQGIHLVRLFP
jgi:hypothetical protein